MLKGDRNKAKEDLFGIVFLSMKEAYAEDHQVNYSGLYEQVGEILFGISESIVMSVLSAHGMIISDMDHGLVYGTLSHTKVIDIAEDQFGQCLRTTLKCQDHSAKRKLKLFKKCVQIRLVSVSKKWKEGSNEKNKRITTRKRHAKI